MSKVICGDCNLTIAFSFLYCTVSRYHSYLNSAKQILQQYNGEEPFASFLKKYFSANKKYGSKDRKQVSNLCYCFFRIGKIADDLPVEEKILMAFFLCSNEPNEILETLKPEWNRMLRVSPIEKLSSVNFQLSSAFPWKGELSNEIDYEKYCESFFTQPDLFIRIRPGYAEPVLLKLDGLKVQYEFISPFTIRLPNSFKADQHFELDKEVVVQDYSSQNIAHFLPLDHGKNLKVWDCCAGSGGKSIMAYDLNPHIELTVSDVRESIFANLKKRFQKAGIKKYKTFISDLRSQLPIPNSQFQLIICDVPCTGSGTWSRTPEQLYYFNENKIEEYSALQKRIVSNVIPHLQPGSSFIYITCSIFKKENEKVVEFIKQKFHLQLKQMELLKGYDKKADSMFIAVFSSLSS